MHKIETINKGALIALRAPIEAALEALGAELGVKLRTGSGTYSPDGTTASIKLEILLDNPERQADAAKAAWDMNCRYIGADYLAPEGSTGLRPEDFGTEFVNKGVRYRTTGLELKRSKFPIRCEALSGPKAGSTLLFGEIAVGTIRRATDAKALEGAAA